MKVAVGAPVAERGWILREWRRGLLRQTLQPSSYCFVYSHSEDDTLSILGDGEWEAPVSTLITPAPFYSRNDRHSDQSDPQRAGHFSLLRNSLLSLFLLTDADLFVSLDTDILLEDSTVLEQLAQTIRDGWDVASPLCYLHAAGAISECYNAGHLGGGEGFTQGWWRVERHELRDYSLLGIGVPMAAMMMRRDVARQCRYRAHDCGEDVGFAQSLAEHRFKVAWRTDLEVRHVWGADYLRRG